MQEQTLSYFLRKTKCESWCDQQYLVIHTAWNRAVSEHQEEVGAPDSAPVLDSD